MYDPFAALLGDDSDDDFDASARKTAHSQGSINGQDLAIVIDDGDSEHASFDEAAMQDAGPLCAESLVAPKGAQGQRLNVKPASFKRKRRCMDPKQKLTLTPIQETNGSSVVCVFASRTKNSEEAIPLWPQYSVTWKGADLNDSTWLVLSNYERWVLRCVDAVTNRCVRKVAADTLVATRREFMACLAKTRVAQDLPSADTDDEVEDANSSRRFCKRVAAIELVIGGYSLVCLNTQKQIVIKVDDVAPEFIRHWFMPLAMKTAHSQVTPKPSPPQPPVKKVAAEPITAASFQFSANPTPNVQGKVLWSPLAHAWQVRIHKPVATLPAKSFNVDPHLKRDEYLKEKSKAYKRAADVWNDFDGSQRLRIKLPTVFLAEHEGV